MASSSASTRSPLSSSRWADMVEDDDQFQMSFQKLTPDSAPVKLFLADHCDTSPIERSRTSTASTSASSGVSLQEWCPNAFAPEFLPTMNVHCGVYYLTPQDSGLPVAGSQPVPTLNGGAIARKMKQRRPVTLMIPSRRTASVRQVETSQKAQGQNSMPEASEEEWLHRAEKRGEAIALGKQTDAYRAFNELKPREMREVDEPMTPDPTDRTVSKRTWKFNVQQWRNSIRESALVYDNGSCDLDETQSVLTATTETGGGATLADVADIDNDCDSSRGSCSS